MPALLVLDPGNATGVAFHRDDGTVVFKTWKLEGVGGGRIVEFDALLNALHSVEGFGGRPPQPHP